METGKNETPWFGDNDFITESGSTIHIKASQTAKGAQEIRIKYRNDFDSDIEPPPMSLRDTRMLIASLVAAETRLRSASLGSQQQAQQKALRVV